MDATALIQESEMDVESQLVQRTLRLLFFIHVQQTACGVTHADRVTTQTLPSCEAAQSDI